MISSHRSRMRPDDPLTASVIGAFYEVYNTLGFGFLEHFYVQAMELELRARGHQVGREVSVGVHYKGHLLGQQRMDMIIDGQVIVEMKAAEHLHPSARRQLFNYLKATRMCTGLLLHVGHEPGVYRVEYPHAKRLRKDPPFLPHLPFRGPPSS